MPSVSQDPFAVPPLAPTFSTMRPFTCPSASGFSASMTMASGAGAYSLGSIVAVWRSPGRAVSVTPGAAAGPLSSSVCRPGLSHSRALPLTSTGLPSIVKLVGGVALLRPSA